MIKDFVENQKIKVPFLVNQLSKGINSNTGKQYLSITLQDASGTIEGKKWEVTDADLEIVIPGKVILVTGEVLKYRNSNQIKILQLGEMNEPYHLPDFIKTAPIEQEELFNKIMEYVLSIKDEKINNFVNVMIIRNIDAFKDYPAASRNHHEYHAGLMHHVYGMLRLADAICSIHENVDRDLLIAGVILHDLGKTVELSGPIIPRYTFEGKLIGHISIMSYMIKELADELGYKDEWVTLLQHMILSHHGKQEYGSPVLPSTLEAELLHEIDNMDSKINMFNKTLNELEEGSFSGKQFSLDERVIYKPNKR